ncbi:DNA-binding protein YbiB [Candidatus Erwinia dacicola]|nr:DNA-binding protein YbiB [Candidatus Erwinia dacicola]NJC99277.1 DNA-binding protein YbiB [Candidatus Erwinia dacicola]
MEYNKIIKEVGRGKNHARDIDIDTARDLYRQMCRQSNLTPLLALLLSRLGFPVLMHGVSDDPTRVTSEAVFAELDIAPVASAAEAQVKLEAGELAFITIGRLCPAIEQQLSLRWRMGVRNGAHTLAKLATPFAEDAALRLASVSHPEYIPRVGKFFSDIGGRGLLLNGTEGEVYANPQRCPSISLIAGTQPEQLLECQEEVVLSDGALPGAKDAETTAAWLRRCLAQEVAVPQSLRLQIACCYLATGRAADLDGALELITQAGF